MSLIINNILDPNDVGTVSTGSLGLFAGPYDTFYVKNSSGTYSPISTSGFNTGLIFNTFSYVLSIIDGNSTQTASLIDLASGYYNTFLSISTSSNVLTLIDGYSTLTASLSYYTGGFNTGISYNTASNVLSITDGNGTISATLSLTGANTSFTFNPFNNVLSIVDGFSTRTASLSLLSGNTGLSFSGGVLTLQDGRGTLTASISTGTVEFKSFSVTISSTDVLTLGTTRVELVPPQGLNKVIIPTKIIARMDYNTTPYTTQGEIDIFSGGTNHCYTLPPDDGFLFGTVSRTVQGTEVVNIGTSNTQYVANSPLDVFMQGGNPTSGDSDIVISGIYYVHSQ